jgi:hypothetical protein
VPIDARPALNLNFADVPLIRARIRPHSAIDISASLVNRSPPIQYQDDQGVFEKAACQ